MKAFQVISAVVVLACAVHALPAANKLSQEEIRASLITKDNVAEYLRNQRQQKAIKQVPEPFVITTSLNVRPSADANSRQSRTYFDKDGATVVEGVRMPDDPTDRVTWRNGRVINNVFVPNDAVAPEPVNVRQRQPKQFNFDDFYRGREPLLSDNMAIESRSDQVFVEPPPSFKESRDYKYHAGSTEQGRPVYYVVEEPDSLHSDRSPYDFEPADTHTSLSSQVNEYTRSGLTQATSGDFVIKEHSYTMCPGCPTFSIPVPIPKTVLGTSESKIEYQHARNRTFLEKIGDRIVNGFNRIQTKVKEVIDPVLETGQSFLGIEDNVNTIQEKIDRPGAPTASAAGGKNYSPFAIASMAAMAIGGMALFASAPVAAQYWTKQSASQARSHQQDSSLKMLQDSIDKYEN